MYMYVRRESTYICDTVNFINKLTIGYQNDFVLQLTLYLLFLTCISPQYLSSCCVDYIEMKDKVICFCNKFYDKVI